MCVCVCGGGGGGAWGGVGRAGVGCLILRKSDRDISHIGPN